MAWRFAVFLIAVCSGEHAAEQRAAAALSAAGHGPGQLDGAALHVSGEGAARVLQHDAEVTAHGYRYAYETENGIRAQESGSGEKGTQAAGTYSYVGPDGQTYSVSYTADENGYRPQGAHLPTPPPIPEVILKALEQNARDEAAGISDDGSYRQQQQHTSNQQYEYSGAAQGQYSQPAQYNQAAQFNQAAQYSQAAQYNQAAQYSQAAPSGESAQYSQASQYKQPAPFSQAVQYDQAGQYNQAPEHSPTAQSEGANQY